MQPNINNASEASFISSLASFSVLDATLESILPELAAKRKVWQLAATEAWPLK
jgi:hypothetical protein